MYKKKGNKGSRPFSSRRRRQRRNRFAIRNYVFRVKRRRASPSRIPRTETIWRSLIHQPDTAWPGSPRPPNESSHVVKTKQKSENLKPKVRKWGAERAYPLWKSASPKTVYKEIKPLSLKARFRNRRFYAADATWLRCLVSRRLRRLRM